jgi:hypothetical protein
MIAIPSIVTVGTAIMWAIDYSKKAHEIQKLRLELEKLKREQRLEEFKATGLYKPTAAEVDAIRRQQERDMKAYEDDASGGPSFAFLVGTALIVAFLVYGAIRLLIDLFHFFRWLF